MNILRLNSEKLRKNATVTLWTVLTTELQCGFFAALLFIDKVLLFYDLRCCFSKN